MRSIMVSEMSLSVSSLLPSPMRTSMASRGGPPCPLVLDDPLDQPRHLLLGLTTTTTHTHPRFRFQRLTCNISNSVSIRPYIKKVNTKKMRGIGESGGAAEAGEWGRDGEGGASIRRNYKKALIPTNTCMNSMRTFKVNFWRRLSQMKADHEPSASNKRLPVINHNYKSKRYATLTPQMMRQKMVNRRTKH
uniref:Uncharacterized protein n=1 Tax=Oryza nivara TaxID=4536 RepID=A0A0E0FZE0_ORYNI